ncbi:molybdopterin synthase sulfur carrier subunit [Saccharobesus litoralis]|uniref:Molybdopterin synthase sulfur carrier subunit n=1 Tax=Saccharobesus litoralis TaxID=2172099 RepID=A0A2S0VVY1_9ALTE|nr:molybdopterin synthase sulfur carrier subunit [Saccharobesus litoralis]AWB68332.1 molybdopterin synthase sulfur carrier subunit [Saccharobesus litoralis]
MIRVLFFAQLRETLDCPGLEVSNENCRTLGQLKALLMTKGDAWQTAFASGKVLSAVNQAMSQDETELNDGDEVAFFPPVTGG